MLIQPHHQRERKTRNLNVSCTAAGVSCLIKNPHRGLVESSVKGGVGVNRVLNLLVSSNSPGESRKYVCVVFRKYAHIHVVCIRSMAVGITQPFQPFQPFQLFHPFRRKVERTATISIRSICRLHSNNTQPISAHPTNTRCKTSITRCGITK